MKNQEYKITAVMIEYLNNHPVGSLEEHINNYANKVSISFNEDEVNSLIEQYN